MDIKRLAEKYDVCKIREMLTEKYKEAIDKFCNESKEPDNGTNDFDYLLEDIMTLDKIMYREFGMKFNFDRKKYERR
ncbi:MAG: hypothetical protein J6X18_06645 [Bacteroidales bacterium]|nr:hypothetical protein [Bacteroidales bacterium]